MLRRLDKFAPLLAMAVIGYLTYTVLDEAQSSEPGGKEPPQVTKAMLNVRFVPAEAHASPADRDPFEVAWSSYRTRREAGRRGESPTSRPTTGPTATAPADAAKTLAQGPELPGELEGVFIGEELRLAVIGEKLYKPGALVGGTDPAACWQVDTVEEDHVILRFGDQTRTLKLVATPNATNRVLAPSHSPASAPAGKGKEGKR